MATHTVTSIPQLITVSGTSDETINIDAVVGPGREALIEWVSGTAIQINAKGAVIATSGTLSTSVTKFIVPYQLGDLLHCKGGAGSETFLITCL